MASSKAKLHDAVDALAGEDRLLHGHLAVGAFEQAPADRGILALGVLAHDAVIDVAQFAPGQRAGMPGISRTGRRFTYWSKPRRNLISESHSDT